MIFIDFPLPMVGSGMFPRGYQIIGCEFQTSAVLVWMEETLLECFQQ